MLTIGCPMAFSNYPMDIQICKLELQSFGYSNEYNNYIWRKPPFLKRNILLEDHDVKLEDFRFIYRSDGETIPYLTLCCLDYYPIPGFYYPGVGIKIHFRRHLGYHLTTTYLPSIIFVIVAWISFHVPSDVVPGRMVLCVTTLLTLTSMFNAVR